MFKKILVPSDGSQLAHKAAEFAADLAQQHGAQVVGVFVIDPFPYIGIGDASAVGLQAYLAEAKAAYRLLRDLNAGLPEGTSRLPGRAAAESKLAELEGASSNPPAR